MSKYPPLKLSSIMPFGKYQGKLVKDIVAINRGYIQWLEDNGIARFDLTEEKDELAEYLLNHPNPFNLEPAELYKAVASTLTRVKKKGDPQIGDWDNIKYVPPVPMYGKAYE